MLWYGEMNDFMLLGELVTDGRTDIGDCRVAFATEKKKFSQTPFSISRVIFT